MLVLHYTGMATVAAALDRLCDPVARVSAHYLVEEDGDIWRLVSEERRAFHAGHSCWAGETTSITSRSASRSSIPATNGAIGRFRKRR